MARARRQWRPASTASAARACVGALAYRTRRVTGGSYPGHPLACSVRRTHPARYYHETFGLTSCSGRGVLRRTKHGRSRPARTPRRFRPVRDACAGAHRARSAQRRASWRLQHLERYDIRRTASVGVCPDAGRRDRGPSRIGRLNADSPAPPHTRNGCHGGTSAASCTGVGGTARESRRSGQCRVGGSGHLRL